MYTKHPLSIVMFLGGLLLLVASLGFLPWIVVSPDSLTAAEVKDFVTQKQYLTLGAGVFGLVFAFLAALKGSKGLAVVAILGALVAGAGVFLAYGSPSELEAAGAEKMGVGFWLAMVGMLDLLVTSVVSLFVFKKAHGG